jgi:hypothetical protein
MPNKPDSREDKTMNILKVSIILGLLVLTETARTDPLDTWTLRNPVPPNVALVSIAYGNDRFVAVGDGGTVLASSNALDWSVRRSGTTNRLSGVAYGDGQFVAVGEVGTILTSADGETWTPRLSGTTNYFSGIAYGNGQFVAVGWTYDMVSGGPLDTILSSVDGVDWVPRESTLDVTTFDVLNGVTYGNGQFVAVGHWYNNAQGDGERRILTSTNGINWLPQQTGTNNWCPRDVYIAYGDGQFVAVLQRQRCGTNDYPATILTSTDAVSWVQRWAGGDGFRGITYGNGRFITTEGNTYDGTNWHSGNLTSADGVTWVFRNSAAQGLAIAYGNGQFVSVGLGGTISTSTDGVTWGFARQPGTGRDLLGITYGNGQFVAVGRGYDPDSAFMSSAILTSGDGVNWVQRQSGTTIGLRAIAYGNDQFVAVGDGYDVASQKIVDAVILTSSNGVNWVHRTSGVQGGDLHGIAYGNGRFVAVGLGFTLTSNDGATWVWQPSGTGGNGVVYGNGKFVAVGDSIAASPDGVLWTQSGAPQGTFSGIAYGSGKFVAVGFGCVRGNLGFEITASSTDGVNWVQYEWPTANGPYGIAYGNGQFVAVGQAYACDVIGPGTIQTSTGGVNWVRRSGWYGSSLNGIAFGNGKFVAVGDGGTIFQSENIIALTLTPSAFAGLSSLALAGPTGLVYTVQSSTDLITWRTLTNITSADPTNIVLDPAPATSGRAFYRAYSQ